MGLGLVLMASAVSYSVIQSYRQTNEFLKRGGLSFGSKLVLQIGVQSPPEDHLEAIAWPNNARADGSELQ